MPEPSQQSDEDPRMEWGPGEWCAEVERLRDLYTSTMNMEASLTAALTEIVRDSPDSENWSRAKARAALAMTGNERRDG